MSIVNHSVPRLVGVAAAGVLAASTLAACTQESGTTESGIEIVHEGHLTICTHLPYAPFQFTNDDGDIVGFDVDLLDLLADDLGLERTNDDIVNIGWEQITSGAVFEANRCDVGMGAMTILPERARALTISDPYFEATQAMLVRTDEPYTSLEELDGERVGVQSDTTGQFYAQDLEEEMGYEVVKYDDLALQLNALKAGNIAAAINDNSPLSDFAENNPDTEVSAQFDTGEVYGFAFKKDDENAEQLAERFNELLAEAFEDGTYEEIYQRWFETDVPFELPPGQ
jgi:polar amino acid transport system substrate-binding protein